MGFDSVLVRDGIATDLGAAEITALERQHNAFANFTTDTFAPEVVHVALGPECFASSL